jgi:predicted Zn finger-like uncharacterized protein
MILTCPACASRYVVDDASVGPAGRTVRCGQCRTSWRAEPPAIFGRADDVQVLTRQAAPGDLPGGALPKQFRARVQAHQQARDAAAAGVVWGIMAAMLGILLMSAVMFRVDVARVWPRTASAYAAVGLPVNVVGLVVEAVTTAPMLDNDRQVLVISGEVRNVSDGSVRPPPLRVDLLDKTGVRLTGRSLDLGDEEVPPGQARPFTVQLYDPPTEAAQVEAGFLLGREVETQAADAGAGGPSLRGRAAPERLAPDRLTDG